MRLCEKCRAAENPLSRLRFQKHLDGKVYCERCLPFSAEVLPNEEAPPPPSFKKETPSAGSLIVIPCPDCLGQGRATRLPNNMITKCSACSGWGRVRIPETYLNVYKPQPMKPVRPVQYPDASAIFEEQQKQDADAP